MVFVFLRKLGVFFQKSCAIQFLSGIDNDNLIAIQ